MANNIITAAYSSSNITYTKPAYQYDYGMILKFSGIDLPQAYEVHFSNTEFCGESISQIGDETGVTIPDEMFLSGNPIYAWTFLHTGEDDGETVYKAVIGVNKRAQPSNLEPTPVQQDAITQAIAALNVAVEQTAQDVISAGESSQAASDAADVAVEARDQAIDAKEAAEDAQESAETAQGKAEDAQEAAERAAGSVLGLTADATVDSNVGTPSVEVEVTTESDHKNMSFAFHNLKGVQGDTGVGISSVVLNSDYTLTINLTNGASYTTSSIRGEVGATPNLTIGTVSTLPEGSQATATITGTEEDPVLNLGIPVGDTGDPGISPTITVTEITGGHNVEITDAQGTTDFDVMDGQSGLITDYVAEEKTPYLFRPSANGLANVISEKDTIVGGTVAWNQQIKAPVSDLSKTESGITFVDNRDGSFSVSGTASADVSLVYSNSSNLVGAKAYHKYIFTGCPLNGSLSTYYLRLGASDTIVDNGSGTMYFRNSASANSWYPAIIVKSGTVISGTIKFYPQWFDITQMFGSTIADYLYTLESGTSGSGIAKLKSWGFFTKDYYPYNSGDLQSVKTSEHRMVRFNQCPFNLTKGTPASAFDATKCVRVIKGQTYELSHGNVTKATTWRNAFSCFDLDGNRIYTGSDITRISGMLGGNPSGQYYVDSLNSTVKSEIFTSNFDGYIQPYILLGDIANDSVAEETCFHFSGIRNGEYEPYSVHSYPLDSDLVLRGVLELDASNNLHYNGDVYKCDGSVTRRYGIVDLGNVTYTKNTVLTGMDRYVVRIDDSAVYGSATKGVILCPNWEVMSVVDANSAMSRNVVASFNKDIYFYTISGDYADATAFKNAMNGKQLQYVLESEVTEQADPYSEYQIVDADGTEEYVDERTVPIPVGHDTYYQQAVDVPQLPTADGSYRLALSLTGNTATASWEYVAQAEMKAQTNIPSGKYFSVGERLFISTQAIAQGANIVVGTNCTETTLADALNQINA